MLRAIGIGLLVAAPLLWLVTGVISPFPTSPSSLEARIERDGQVDAKDVRLAVWGGIPHSYDEANDTTLMYVAWCNHSLCGPLVRLPGDLRGGESTGPWMLVPRGERLSLTDAGDFTEKNATFARARDEGPAIDAVFDVSSPVPPFVGRLAALVALGAGLALVARPTWASLAPAAAAGAFGSTPAALHASWVILVQLGGFLAVITGAVAAIAVILARRRVPWFPLGLALAGALSIAIGLTALTHFDPSGAGD